MFEKDELINWLSDVGKHIEKPVSLYMIGGGAMSFKGLKPRTKDIDLIVLSRNDFQILNDAILKAGYSLESDLHDEFYLTALAVYKMDDSRIDVFLERVGQMLTFTSSMVERAAHFRSYHNLSVHLVANEDIFLFKSMTSRSGDIFDCDRLMKENLDYSIIYDELVSQSSKQAWYFWVFEKLCLLEEYNAIQTPLKKRLLLLIKENWGMRPTDFMNAVPNPRSHIK